MTGLLTLGHRPRRVTAPFAPAARIQRRAAQTRDFHGDDVGYGADAAAAVVHHGRRVATGEQGFKLGAQLSSWFELAAGVQVQVEGPVQGTGDVAGHRVEWLDFTPEARCATGVKEGLRRASQLLCYCFSSY